MVHAQKIFCLLVTVLAVAVAPAAHAQLHAVPQELAGPPQQLSAPHGVAFSPYKFKGAAAPGLEGWFKDAKLGMFMHWGPVSQWGTEISFPLLCSSFPCHPKGPNNTATTITTTSQLAAHRQAYADLASTFDPVNFDAKAMAKLAKAAGFKYLIYTTMHCDGFVNWPSNVTGYNIQNTPWGRKGRGTYSELVKAFRAEGLKVGAYVCPSLWNNDDYFPPKALTSFGPCCRPNYLPASDPKRWNKVTSFLHGLVTELSELYAPDTFWFDCFNSPPNTDTHLEAVVDTMRKANPDVVINIRNGMWSDYTESSDQSERLANTIFGTPQEYVGDYFEIPAVMQSSRQWAYDPKSTQKPTAEFIANLMMLVAKGGNYLMNVAPDPLGTWPASALLTLAELSDWFAINAESIHDTRPAWPYQQGELFTVTSSATSSLYILIPAMTPDHAELTVGHPTPTGHAAPTTLSPQPSTIHAALMAGKKNLSLPWLRPSLFATPIKTVELLGNSATIGYTVSDAEGMVVDGITAHSKPPFDCSAFGCTCKGMGAYYGVNHARGFGCAPPSAENWWQQVMNCTVAGYDNATIQHPPGCDPAPPSKKKTPAELGLVLKIGF